METFTIYIEALSSCAIEGNEFAIKMLELRKTDKDKFMVELFNFIKKMEKANKEQDDEDMLDDGFGMQHSAWCPECGKKTVEIVRPGIVQCTNCDGIC